MNLNIHFKKIWKDHFKWSWKTFQKIITTRKTLQTVAIKKLQCTIINREKLQISLPVVSFYNARVKRAWNNTHVCNSRKWWKGDLLFTFYFFGGGGVIGFCFVLFCFFFNVKEVLHFFSYLILRPFIKKTVNNYINQ